MKILEPIVNTSTLKDDRGAILTYMPEKDTIKEWSYIVTFKGVDRGDHNHPEFDEYVILVQGHGCYIETFEDEEFVHLIGPGDCIYIPKGCIHTLKPFEDCRMIAMLTKPWDDCEVPVVNSEVK